MLSLTAASAAHAASSTLRVGSHGRSVTALQRELTQTGLKVSADGQYGSATDAAVRAFQQAANLHPNGIADHTTRHRLTLATVADASSAQIVNPHAGGVSIGAPHGASILGDRIPLIKGMSGDDVRSLQQLLAKNGMHATADGMFGAQTVREVRAFQHRVGLTSDGTVDAGVIDALRGDMPAPTTTTGGDDPTDTNDTTATTPAPLGPGDTATIGSDGLAIAPASAPLAVQQIIAAGNRIATLPYRYGGGHGSFHDTAYDCSGSVSYALHGAGLLDTTMDSTQLESWGESGPGQWVTVYANAGHTYMVVAGLRFDTSGATAHGGDRWQKAMVSGDGYVVRHPKGL